MQNNILLDGESFNLDVFNEAVYGSGKIKLSKDAEKNIDASRKIVEDLFNSDEHVYGINTGFGKLSNVNIPTDQVEQLQFNLIRSHACGAGDDLAADIVKGMMILLVNGFSKGNSGVRKSVANAILELVNKGVVPKVPCQGSLGASGDLIPLAHAALVLIGEGSAFVDGKEISGKAALKKADIPAITLQAKEGLCLINGTYVMTAIGSIAAIRTRNLLKLADLAASMTLEATLSTVVHANSSIQKIKPHIGQINSAKNIRKLTASSELVKSHKDCGQIQDAYSIRCTPQVHGASRDAVDYAKKVLEIEMNSSTDNPLVIDGKIVSAGNFHGEALALALDTLGIAVTNLGNLSERRTERMVNPDLSGLPAFLTPNPGLNSGLMMPHYLAAALTLENRGLATPASIESVPTSANKEDYISNGMWSARKALQIVKNTENIIAVELMFAAQAKEFNPKLKFGKGTDAAYKTIRKYVPKLKDDRFLQKDILKTAELIHNGELLKAVEKAVGELK